MVLASMRSESEPFPIKSQARLFAVDYEPDNRLDKGKVAHSQPTCCSSVTLAQTFTHDLPKTSPSASDSLCTPLVSAWL